jgi:hypothetical protein
MPYHYLNSRLSGSPAEQQQNYPFQSQQHQRQFQPLQPPAPYLSSSSLYRAGAPEYPENSPVSTKSRLTTSSHRTEMTGNAHQNGDGVYDGEDSSPMSGVNASGSHSSRANITKASGSKAKQNSAASDDHEKEDGPHAIARRKKKAVSCEGCRRRKLKCDRGWPVSESRALCSQESIAADRGCVCSVEPVEIGMSRTCANGREGLDHKRLAEIKTTLHFLHA